MSQSSPALTAELASLAIRSHDLSTKTLTVMDPEGDIILVLGDVGLQVSSKVLSLASPVFKAMFGPHFAEGQGQASSTKIRRVKLHDDDVEAMKILCKHIS